MFAKLEAGLEWVIFISLRQIDDSKLFRTNH